MNENEVLINKYLDQMNEYGPNTAEYDEAVRKLTELTKRESYEKCVENVKRNAINIIRNSEINSIINRMDKKLKRKNALKAVAIGAGCIGLTYAFTVAEVMLCKKWRY